MTSALFVPVATTAVIAGVGWVYGVAAVVLNLLFLGLAYRVWKNEATDAAAMKPEKQLFAFSILYLFLLFAIFAFDRMLMS